MRQGKKILENCQTPQPLMQCSQSNVDNLDEGLLGPEWRVLGLGSRGCHRAADIDLLHKSAALMLCSTVAPEQQHIILSDKPLALGSNGAPQ